MPISAQEFQRMEDARKAQADALTGRDRPVTPQSDPVREALNRHREAERRARAKTEANMPERGPRPPAPPPPARPAWDVELRQQIGDILLSTPLSLELRRLIRGAGAENVLTGLMELGIIARFERGPEPEPTWPNVDNAIWLSS